MRPIGREQRDSSPVIRDGKGSAASTPASRRIPVPELPQSISSLGGLGCIAVPVMVMMDVFGSRSTTAPSCCIAVSVCRQSALQRKFSTRVLPCARPARIATRWEMLLSPGTQSSPHSPRDNLPVLMVSVCMNFKVFFGKSLLQHRGTEDSDSNFLLRATNSAL